MIIYSKVCRIIFIVHIIPSLIKREKLEFTFWQHNLVHKCNDNKSVTWSKWQEMLLQRERQRKVHWSDYFDYFCLNGRNTKEKHSRKKWFDDAYNYFDPLGWRLFDPHSMSITWKERDHRAIELFQILQIWKQCLQFSPVHI